MKTIALCSLLHEPVGAGSRAFRGEPVLAWTLRRLKQSSVAQTVLLAWDDQLPTLTFADASAHACGPRRLIPSLQSTTAALKWADGWRGGLLGAAWFDRGYVARFVADAIVAAEADAIVLVDAAAALVDPAIVDLLIAAATRGERDFYFTAAAPGLGGVLLKRSLVQRLGGGNATPGRIVSYLPDAPVLDPVTSDACIELPLTLTRAVDRFVLDSDRQICRIDCATQPLNGTLATSAAQTIVEQMRSVRPAHDFPREIAIEITTRRATRPTFAAGSHIEVSRVDMSLEVLRKIAIELAQVDDVRLTLAGAGDPLLHPQIVEVLHALRDVYAVSIETDLVDASDDVLKAIVNANVDVVAVHLPAMSPAKYQQVMGCASMPAVLENVKRLLAIRQQLGRGTPIVVPLFTKLAINLDEMEQWYDAWLRALQSAVIVGPSDFAGQIPDLAAADMAPPKRGPCRRIERRMMVLSTGDIVRCEQDALGLSPLGNLGTDSVRSVWQKAFPPLREAHQRGGLALPVLCGNCREWDRP